MKSTKNTLLLSTAYLPPVEYFVYLLQYPVAVIEQYETYPKQTYRNRTEIYTEKGKTTLSVPVSKKNGNHTRTSEIVVNNSEKWQLNHWRAIESAYIASPFFLFYKDHLLPFYNEHQVGLLEMNMRMIQTICEVIGIRTKFMLSEHFQLKPEDTLDLRTAIHPKKPSTLDAFPHYEQVFADRHGFVPDLSIIDLLFNLGPETRSYLDKLTCKTVDLI